MSSSLYALRAFSLRTGAAILLLLCAGACTPRPDAARGTDPSDSPSPSSRIVRAGDRSSAAMRRTADTDPDVVWSGESGGHAVRWLKSDLLIGSGRDTGGGAFSLAEEIRKGWVDNEGGDAGDDSADGGPCAHGSSFRPLSVVGSIVSVELTDYMNCPGTAHPSVVTWYSVIDAADPYRTVMLNEFFSERDIFAALMADGIVRKTLAKAGSRTPSSLPELIEMLAESGGECEYYFAVDMLAHFAFHHLEGNRVAVRIGLSHGIEACRGMLTQLGILLPVPPSLAAALKAADAGTAGYVMHDLKKIAGDAKSTISNS